MTARKTNPREVAVRVLPEIDPYEALVDKFAGDALQGLLKDPNVNPRNPESAATVVDFAWYIGRLMVERRPPPGKVH